MNTGTGSKKSSDSSTEKPTGSEWTFQSTERKNMFYDAMKNIPTALLRVAVEQEIEKRIFEQNCQDPVMGIIYRHIGRSWFVSMEEVEYWYKLFYFPQTGHDSALEKGLEE